MTTPPTTAGWYPDPDGSGGQRYWDGAAWTDQGPDGPDTPAVEEQTSAWPAELPPWPEDMAMPSWEDAGKIEPADETEPEAAVVVDPPQITEVPEIPETPDVPEASHDLPEPASAENPDAGADQPTAEVPLPEPSVAGPPPLAAFVVPPAPAEVRPAPRSPLKSYLIGVGALLMVLAGVLVWAFAFADPGTGTTEATGTDGSPGTSGTTAAATDSAAPTEPTAVAAADGGGQVTDGDVTITSKGVEITPTVSAVDNEMMTKTASGEFVVVRLTLLNNGQLPATFLADQQVLNAGGQTFNAETESTFYLGGISAVLYPGAPVDVAFAFDVPPGTAPESVQVHGDLASEGAVLPLS